MCLINSYDNRIRDIIIYAYTHSPFYKWFYKLHDVDVYRIRGLQDYYCNIPILKKEDILKFIEIQNINDIRQICCDQNDILTFSTTGTTSKRLTVPYAKSDLELHAQNIIRALEWWGYKRGQIINSLSFGHSNDLSTVFLSYVARLTGGENYLYTKIKEQINSNNIKKGEFITFINSLSLLISMFNSSSYMDLFRKINLKYILTLVTPPELKSNLHIEVSKKIKDINLIPAYASVEMGAVGIACPYIFQGAYTHIIQNSLFHIMNQSNTLCDNGVGRLVYTSLDRKAFPFIKYDVGDVVSLKISNNLCDCGFPNKIIRFEYRQSLSVKIPNAAGYFIDVLKIDEIIKQLLPGSQIICVYGEHKTDYYLFLAIFIGVVEKIKNKHEEEQIKNTILERIIQTHLPDHKIKEAGISNLISKFRKNFPIFFISILDIPKEEGANKPKLVLNLMENKELIKLNVYQNLFSKLRDYL